MNVAEMVKNVNAECHPITNIDGIIKRWLNRGQKVVASKGPDGGWFWLRQWGYEVATVADQSEYALSPLVDTSKIITFYETTTPNNLRHMTEQEFRRIEPEASGSGDSYLYRLKGFSPVQNQPTSASALSIVSSSASDTAVDIKIQGLDGSDVLQNETVTLTGTTPASSSNSYKKILSLSKDAKSVGKVTITSNSAAVTNVVISPYDRHTSHPLVALYDIPDSVITMYYDFTMKMLDIYEDDDTSLIPEQYHDAIELYAKVQCFKHLNNPTMAQLTFQEFERRIEDMKSDYTLPNGVFTMESFEVRGLLAEARLPGNFPRD